MGRFGAGAPQAAQQARSSSVAVRLWSLDIFGIFGMFLSAHKQAQSGKCTYNVCGPTNVLGSLGSMEQVGHILRPQLLKLQARTLPACVAKCTTLYYQTSAETAETSEELLWGPFQPTPWLAKWCWWVQRKPDHFATCGCWRPPGVFLVDNYGLYMAHTRSH